MLPGGHRDPGEAECGLGLGRFVRDPLSRTIGVRSALMAMTHRERRKRRREMEREQRLQKEAEEALLLAQPAEEAGRA